MRHTSFIILCLLYVACASGQTYTYDDVLVKADKALRQVLPAHLIPATQVHYSPYYLSLTSEEEWKLLEKGKKTKGKLQKIHVRYQLALQQTSCVEYGGVLAIIELELDNRLELVKDSILDDIPEFVLKNLPCPFISRAEATKIAARNDVYAEESSFYFSKNKAGRRIYYLLGESYSYLENGPESKEVFEMQMLEIDALTGDVLKNSFKLKEK